MSDKRTHTPEAYTVGEHMDEFEGVEDCVNKVEYYLNNFEQMRDMAESGYQHVMQDHTYSNRAELLHKIINKWHDGQRGLIS